MHGSMARHFLNAAHEQYEQAVKERRRKEREAAPPLPPGEPDGWDECHLPFTTVEAHERLVNAANRRAREAVVAELGEEQFQLGLRRIAELAA